MWGSYDGSISIVVYVTKKEFYFYSNSQLSLPQLCTMY